MTDENKMFVGLLMMVTAPLWIPIVAMGIKQPVQWDMLFILIITMLTGYVAGRVHR